MVVAISISVIFCIAYCVLIIIYYLAWKSIPEFVVPKMEDRTQVSVIIPARNEASNIINCLTSLKNQTYSKGRYEVILVDDHSTDNTWDLMQRFPNEEMRYRKIKLSDHMADSVQTIAFKKKAIQTGIEQAAGELIITSDADCTFEKNWLETMVGFYQTTQAQFIAAPVKITGKYNLLTLFQTLDFLTMQGITAGSVFKKFHSMCNGANLAYEKKIFFEVGGFRGIDHIPSGDDMMLMHKIFVIHPDGVLFLKNKQAIVSTHAEKDWSAFFNQRIRWASKADLYDEKGIFWILLLVYFFNLLFLVLAVASFWNYRYLIILLSLLIAKTLIEFPFVASVASFFDQQGMMFYFPFLQPLHIMYIIFSGWMGKFGTYQWKSRKVKRSHG